MAAPIGNFPGMLSRMFVRNSGLMQASPVFMCSKLTNDIQRNYNCLHKHQSKCVNGHISAQIRHYSFRGYRGKLSFDTPRKSQDFVGTLSPIERKMILNELQSFEDKVVQEGDSGIGSRMGGWELENVSQAADGTGRSPPIPPTREELKQVLVSNCVPFIGFGFLDNAIMICAGDYIDFTIGATLCISTMAAAALGNLISDMAGIGLAGYVEALALRFGFQGPLLSNEQLELKSSRRAAGLGRGLGIFIGCVLGMFPLLFIKTRQDIEEETHSDGHTEDKESSSAEK